MVLLVLALYKSLRNLELEGIKTLGSSREVFVRLETIGKERLVKNWYSWLSEEKKRTRMIKGYSRQGVVQVKSAIM